MKRYRNYDSFPGFDIDAISAQSFVKAVGEWNLPPIRFTDVGDAAFFLSSVRPALFGGVLLGDPGRHIAHDYETLGFQLDWNFTIAVRLPMTFSIGYARGLQRQQHHHPPRRDPGVAENPLETRHDDPIPHRSPHRAGAGVRLPRHPALFDSYRLISLSEMLQTIAAGVALALAAYFINGYLLRTLDVGYTAYSRFGGPVVEELLKASALVVLFARNRIGFMIDATIMGFGVGTGFACSRTSTTCRRCRTRARRLGSSAASARPSCMAARPTCSRSCRSP